MWTGENDSHTLRVDAHIFLENGEKNLRFQKYPDACGRGLSEWDFLKKSQLIVQSCFNFFIAPSAPPPTLRKKNLTFYKTLLFNNTKEVAEWNFTSDKWKEHFSDLWRLRGIAVYGNGIFMDQIPTDKVCEKNGKIISGGKIPSVPKWEGRRQPLAGHERTRASGEVALESPFACCSHVTSRDSHNWRAYSQAKTSLPSTSFPRIFRSKRGGAETRLHCAMLIP